MNPEIVTSNNSTVKPSKVNESLEGVPSDDGASKEALNKDLDENCNRNVLSPNKISTAEEALGQTLETKNVNINPDMVRID